MEPVNQGVVPTKNQYFNPEEKVVVDKIHLYKGRLSTIQEELNRRIHSTMNIVVPQHIPFRIEKPVPVSQLAEISSEDLNREYVDILQTLTRLFGELRIGRIANSIRLEKTKS